MKSLILYSTQGCHLCEKAKELIWPQLENTPYQLEEVDIADDSALMAQYSLTIPVLINTYNNQQLPWPFDINQIRDLITE